MIGKNVRKIIEQLLKHNLHREGWHYITVKKLPALLREITLNSTVIFIV